MENQTLCNVTLGNGTYLVNGYCGYYYNQTVQEIHYNHTTKDVPYAIPSMEYNTTLPQWQQIKIQHDELMHKYKLFDNEYHEFMRKYHRHHEILKKLEKPQLWSTNKTKPVRIGSEEKVEGLHNGTKITMIGNFTNGRFSDVQYQYSTIAIGYSFESTYESKRIGANELIPNFTLVFTV